MSISVFSLGIKSPVSRTSTSSVDWCCVGRGGGADRVGAGAEGGGRGVGATARGAFGRGATETGAFGALDGRGTGAGPDARGGALGLGGAWLGRGPAGGA
jgi:hypothetical protein